MILIIPFLITIIFVIIIIIYTSSIPSINNSKLSVFSEGNQYLNTFSPIVKELIKRKIHFNYYTLDNDDELLDLKNEYFNPYFLGVGILGHLRFKKISTENLLSTTPNIGNKKFPLKRPKKVDNLIHVWHSISDIGYYRKGSLDNYDTILNVGQFQNKSIEAIKKIRKTNIQKLIPVGLPYYDQFVKKIKQDDSRTKSILIGSSWGNKGLLKNHGYRILDILKDRKIIIRPHPQSFFSEKKFIEDFKAKCDSMQNVEWDDSNNPLDSFRNASILISDTSSIRYDFSFLTLKPVITLKINNNYLQEYECNHLKERWDERTEKILGTVIHEDNISTLSKEIDILFSRVHENNLIQKLKENTLFSIGNSSKNIVDYIISIINDKDNVNKQK